MSLETNAISSMNYFFLRFITKKQYYDTQIIQDELQNFVHALSKETSTLNKETYKAIASEVEEGNYFDYMLPDQVRDLVDEAVEELAGEILPAVSDFYVRVVEECGLFDE